MFRVVSYQVSVILVDSDFWWCAVKYGSKLFQRQKLCMCFPGAQVTEGW